ncbi:MAG: hypothetical protein PUD43_07535 [Clostridia bacterium]|nr:hypothetical protein [Clostridia bacterium]
MNDLWKDFVNSGSIDDYLKYRKNTQTDGGDGEGREEVHKDGF